MTKILVKNGDWDKARADLGTMLDAKRNSFNAQFEAAFGAPRKPAEAAQPAANLVTKPAPAKTAPGVILSRPRSR
jgi:hypothetical protein